MAQGYDDIPEVALDWHQAGLGAALATVVETWGSAPRPVGSQLAISGDAQIMGSVSGGCVEGAVVEEAIEALETGESQLLEFGVSDDQAFAVGLACGGRIRVLVEPVGTVMREDVLEDLVAARAARRPVAYVFDLDERGGYLAGPDAYPDRFRMDASGLEPDGKTFVAIHNPPLRMAVVGAVHIAQPLMQMARLAGYDAVLIDPRETFGAEARFPDETISNEWPDEALDAFGLDPRTAVVALTHDPKIDDPALESALRSKVFYIGALGSRRTHGQRVERLWEKGFDRDAIDRIHAPVGLDIGARSPAEIAISIMAEITQRLRKG